MTFLLLLVLLVCLPAAAAFLFQHPISHRPSTRSRFGIGTPIVYRQDEVSACPVSEARDVHPSERGEYYYYSILNYLRVIEVLGDGRIIAVARDRKRLCLWPNDSSLRKARLAERLLHPLRFPHS